MDEKIETIYFGGGTPSILSLENIGGILETIHKNYSLNLKEVTLEANPDDLKVQKLRGLLDMGISRLSIGIQSFNDQVLSFYNRSHSADESLKAIDLARGSGFDKLSIDLIYGFPSADHELWRNDLKIAIEQQPDHISSYCLTIEPRTALGNWTTNGRFQPSSEDFQAEQFEILQEDMEASGYLQYEISNFARNGAFSVHNTNYWKAVPYLGVGPSAHSYDGKNRGHNPPNNVGYVKSLTHEKLPFMVDELTMEENINEYLLTSLRTVWGVDLIYLKNKYQVNLLEEKQHELELYQNEKMLSIINGHVLLSRKGKLLADYIASKLFV